MKSSNNSFIYSMPLFIGRHCYFDKIDKGSFPWLNHRPLCRRDAHSNCVRVLTDEGAEVRFLSEHDLHSDDAPSHMCSCTSFTLQK